jgi:hypothetical protein
MSIRARPAGRAAVALFVLVATSAAAVGASFEALLTPRLGPRTAHEVRWPAHEEASSAGIDHSTWDRLPRAYRVPAAARRELTDRACASMVRLHRGEVRRSRGWAFGRRQ